MLHSGWRQEACVPVTLDRPLVGLQPRRRAALCVSSRGWTGSRPHSLAPCSAWHPGGFCILRLSPRNSGPLPRDCFSALQSRTMETEERWPRTWRMDSSQDMHPAMEPRTLVTTEVRSPT